MDIFIYTLMFLTQIHIWFLIFSDDLFVNKYWK
jgi:hypothetical protein